MHEYELMYILHPRLTADEANDAMARVGILITERGGEVLSAENWGRRRLSYPINHNFEGTYVLAVLQLAPNATGPVESALRISEDVIRHLLIRGIIPYEGPSAHDDRARGPQAMASDSPEAVEETASDADIVGTVSDADAGEAAAAVPADDGGGDGEAGAETEEPRAAVGAESTEGAGDAAGAASAD